MSTVNDILKRKGGEVVSLTSEESVLNAARLMNERGIGGLVVTKAGEMAGIFTERDILRRVVAENLNPAEVKLADVMTRSVVTCRPQATLDQCSTIITEKRIRHLPVVEGQELRGIVTSGDILALRAEEQANTIEFLEGYVFDLRG